MKAIVFDKTGSYPIISAGITTEPAEFLRSFAEYFDYFSTYMDVPPHEPSPSDYPYEMLGDFVLNLVEALGKSGIPYQPFLPAGWNPRPWHDPRPCYAIPTPEQFEALTEKFLALLQAYPTLSISDGETTLPAFSIYAWNEFGEGGYLAPTLIKNDGKLSALARALQKN